MSDHGAKLRWKVRDSSQVGAHPNPPCQYSLCGEKTGVAGARLSEDRRHPIPSSHYLLWLIRDQSRPLKRTSRFVINDDSEIGVSRIINACVLFYRPGLVYTASFIYISYQVSEYFFAISQNNHVVLE